MTLLFISKHQAFFLSISAGCRTAKSNQNASTTEPLQQYNQPKPPGTSVGFAYRTKIQKSSRQRTNETTRIDEESAERGRTLRGEGCPCTSWKLRKGLSTVRYSIGKRRFRGDWPKHQHILDEKPHHSATSNDGIETITVVLCRSKLGNIDEDQCSEPLPPRGEETRRRHDCTTNTTLERHQDNPATGHAFLYNEYEETTHSDHS